MRIRVEQRERVAWRALTAEERQRRLAALRRRQQRQIESEVRQLRARATT